MMGIDRFVSPNICLISARDLRATNRSCAFPVLQIAPISYRDTDCYNALTLYDHIGATLCESHGKFTKNVGNAE